MGEKIKALQSQTQTLLDVSKNGILFPGTPCRVVSASGSKPACLASIKSVLSLFSLSPRREYTIAVPATDIAAIIGTAGGTVKLIQKATGTKVGINTDNKVRDLLVQCACYFQWDLLFAMPSSLSSVSLSLPAFFLAVLRRLCSLDSLARGRLHAGGLHAERSML